MKILILDDDESRHKIFAQKLIGQIVIHVYTAKKAIDCLENDEFDYVFLDHDLGGQSYVKSGEGTGYEVAQWLEKHPERQPKNIIIHSFNPDGARNMARLLPTAIICPGVWNNIIRE